jgi:hypothetical protein
MAKTAKKPTKMGRPTKYKPKFCQMLVDFFDIEPFEKIELPHYQNDGKTIKWKDYKLIPARMPTLRKFAKKIDVNIFRVYCWIDEKSPTYHKEFSDAFACAKDIRKDWLIDLGLSGLTPPLSYKFTAINVTDMRDQQETKLTGVVGTRELSAMEMAEIGRAHV